MADSTQGERKNAAALAVEKCSQAGRLPSPFDRPGAPDRPWDAPSLDCTSLGKKLKGSTYELEKVSASLVHKDPPREHDRRRPKQLRLRTDGLRVGFALRFCSRSF